MATRTLIFLKWPANLYLLRCLKGSKQSLHICQMSTCKILNAGENTPVKFTTSRAGKVSIGETVGLSKPNLEFKIRKAIILTSLVIFMIYFCILREENDIDECIGGNRTDTSEELELIDLKIKLAYCEKNNLPTMKLKTRIQEIVNKNMKPAL